jgi:pyruvate kinase
LLDDGRLSFEVLSVVGNKVNCRVLSGGELSNNKGINRLGGGLSAAALTDKDRTDMQAAMDFEVDYIAISFPRNVQDILEARAIINQRDPSVGIIAKIERTEALVHIDDIILASDGVMVARGDLAVEIGDAEVPAVQKQLIKRARALNKPVITATQMMESMVTSKVPTRAEVSDVANAVLDTSDAVMLSAETAVGSHPALVVDTVARICVSAERHPHTQRSKHRIECYFERIDEAIAMAAMYTANHMNIRAIIAFTETGTTTLWMSRIRTSIPIYGLSRHARARGKMTLYRDVYPFAFIETPVPHEQINEEAIRALQSKGLVTEGDLVILTKGDYAGVRGNTNSLQILTVGAL